MFITAMARPQMRPDDTFFDGRIGMWPAVKSVITKRKSKNSDKGTTVVESMTVTSESSR